MAIALTDTHCHIQFADYPLNAEEVLTRGKSAGVSRAVVVGCTLADSQLGVAFAEAHDNVWATIGLHPHEAKDYVGNQAALDTFTSLAAAQKVVGIGECGLDYFYGHSPREQQIEVLRFQLELAQAHDLPLSFHVREAFPDFWPIFEEYHAKKPLRGVLHSFTDTLETMYKAVNYGLYIGVNGIATFSRPEQQAMYRQIPLDNLVLETDAPFLTPKPYRGTICELRHVRVTAEFLADLRQETLEQLAKKTTTNAQTLFNLT